MTTADVALLPGPQDRSLSASRWTSVGLDTVPICVAVTLIAVAFFPGLMNPDVLGMYARALGAGAPTDWHSPLIVWIWRGILHAGGDIGLFLVVQVTVFFVAFAWILRLGNWPLWIRWISIAALVVLPPFATWLATLDKTSCTGVMLCICFTAALAAEQSPGRWSFVLMLMTGVLGAWTRINGITIFAPALAWSSWRARWPRLSLRLAIGAYCTLIMAGGPIAAGRLGLLAHTHPQQATMDLDLLNLSFLAGRSLFPDGVLREPLEQAEEQMAADRYSYIPVGMSTHFRAVLTSPAEVSALQDKWLEAIDHNPIGYLRYRTGLFLAFQCFDFSRTCLDSWNWYNGGIDPNPYGLTSHHIPFIFNAYRALAGSVFYRPFFYTIAMLAILLTALRRQHGTVAVYASILLLYDFSMAVLIPGTSVRMIYPLGMVLPFLIAGLAMQQPARRDLPGTIRGG